MATNPCVVELFYDVISPYSYIAFELLCRCSRRWRRLHLQLHPVLLGGIMQATGNKPPALVPSRGKYLLKDLERIAAFYNLPLKQPEENNVMATGSLKAQRFLTAIKMECPEYLEEATRQLYIRACVEDKDVSEDESIIEACQAAGISRLMAKNLLDLTKQTDVKEALKNTTARAIEYGAFGAPTYVLHIDGKKEMFFGADRLFLLAHYLGERWPVSKL